MIKKFLSFAVAAFVLISLTSCGRQPVQAGSEVSASSVSSKAAESSAEISNENKDELQQKFTENNKIEAILEKHESVIYSQIDKINGDVYYRSYYKNDSGEYVSTEICNNYGAYETKNSYLVYSTEEKTMIVNAQEEQYTSISENSFYYKNEHDEVISIAENADGDIELKEKSKLDAEAAEDYSEMWDTHEGDYFISISVFDKATYMLKETNFRLLHSDTGEMQDVAVSVICTSDEQEIPVVLGDILSLPTHKLTLNLASGEVREFDIPEGFSGDIEIEEDKKLYTDKDGKIPYESTEKPLANDLELFIR